MIKYKNNIFYLLTTRFNNDTFEENKNFRIKHMFNGCIYNQPKEMPCNVNINSNNQLIVFEMNNERNEIMGVGILKRRIYKRYKIHCDMNYNRYTYIGKHRIDRDDMTREDIEYLKIFETMVFKGYDHVKRGHGFICIPQKKIERMKKQVLSFIEKIILYCNITLS